MGDDLRVYRPETVPFSGGDITAIKDEEGRVLVALRPICDRLEVDFNGQQQRLKRQPWATVCVIHMVAEDGKARPMICVDRQTFAMWLATIDTTRLGNVQAAERIVLYQKEAAGVLDRHFSGEVARPQNSLVSMCEMLLETVKKQVEMEQRLTVTEKKIDAAIESTNGNTRIMALLGFCKLRDIRMSRAELAVAGTKLANQCRAAGIPIRPVYSEAYGSVNGYPLEVLEAWAASRAG